MIQRASTAPAGNAERSAGWGRARSWLARTGSAVAEDWPLALACFAVVSLGIFLRFWKLAYPASMMFDEHHFVDNARSYLKAGADHNDHPPLGKLLIAAGMLLFGDDSLGWRATPAAFGVLTIFLAAALARTLFRDRRAGWIAAALIAGDGFFITYSRTALRDGMLASLALATAVATVRARRAWHVWLACVLAGLATSIKLSAAVLIAPILIVTIGSSQAPAALTTYVAVVPAVFYITYASGLAIAGAPYGVGDVWRATTGLMNHHLALNQMAHPLTSRFYTWLIPTKPLLLWSEAMPDGMVRVMSSLGNPLLWWTSSIAMVAASSRLAWRGIASVRGDPDVAGGSPWQRAVGRASAWLALYWVAFMAPWVISRRDSYVYHYLPSYAFGVVLVGGLIAYVYGRRRKLGLAAVLVVCLVAVFYAPIAAQLPISPAALRLRLFLDWWR
jgi:dolichyl-phosphate-mannose-protein mannosyltransferase